MNILLIICFCVLCNKVDIMKNLHFWVIYPFMDINDPNSLNVSAKIVHKTAVFKASVAFDCEPPVFKHMNYFCTRMLLNNYKTETF